MMRFLRLLTLLTAFLLMAFPAHATFCVPGKKPPQPVPPETNPPNCKPECHNCSGSPCFLQMATYVNDWADLQIPTAGRYPLQVARRYDSARPTDGPLGAGWSSSLTAHLYYAAYLKSAPSTYSYEADVMLPDGSFLRFTDSGSGSFTSPFGRYDALVRNGDGTWSLTLEHTNSVYRFNTDGSIASLTDDFGSVITYTYGSNGQISRIADSGGSGRYVDVTWGADGRIASVADNAGRVLKYFYEGSNGTLTSVSDPSVSGDSSQRSTYFSYVPGRFGPVLSHIEDRWHRRLSDIDWYPTGQLKSYTDGRFDGTANSEGEKYSFTYNPTLGTVTKTHSLGSKTYTVLTTGPANDAFTTYDAAGEAQSRSAYGGGTFGATYNALGDVASVSAGSGDASVTWTFTYDPAFPHNVASVIPKDRFGNLSRIWPGYVLDYDQAGTASPGALARVWRVRSDTTTKDLVGSYTHDSRGRILTATHDGFFVGSFAYNAAGDLLSLARDHATTFAYDALGRRTTATNPAGGITTYTYDALGRVLTITLPKPTPTSPLTFTTTFSYDNYDATTGLVFTNRTDPNGRVTKIGYDALGHIAQTIDAAGNIAKFGYQYGVLKTMTDANNNVTTYGYDGARELNSVTYPDGAIETYSISNGVLFSKRDRKGQTVSYTYDALGRLSRISYPGVNDPYGSVVGQEFAYAQQNPLGGGQYGGFNLTTIFDHTATGVTTYIYTYDSSWRPLTENNGSELTTLTYVPSPWPSTYVQSYKIEPATGHPWNPQTVTYGYDGVGRVNSISWNWIPSGSFSYTYSSLGQYSRITFPNGQSRNYSYDNQGRLTNLTNSDGAGGVLASFDYGYDYDWTTNTNGTLGQRTSVNVGAPAGTSLETGTTKYRYDALYQLTRVDHPNGVTDSWTYDAIGNRLTANGNTYAYYKNGANPLNGQRMRTYQAGFPDMLYDANGNLTGFSNLPNTYVWDYAGRLTSNSGNGFTYDYLGRRRSVTAGTSNTKYIPFGPHTVAERNTSSGVASDYLFGPGVDEPLAKIVASGAISYYGVDGLGSVVLVTDANGGITASGTYGAFGEGGLSEPFGYTGHEGSFFRARYYGAGWGRFLSEDPLGPAFDLNLYRYVLNNPINFVDPSGKQMAQVVTIVEIIVVTGITAIIGVELIKYVREHPELRDILRPPLPDIRPIPIPFPPPVPIPRAMNDDKPGPRPAPPPPLPRPDSDPYKDPGDCKRQLAICLRFAKDQCGVAACIEAYNQCRQKQGLPF